MKVEVKDGAVFYDGCRQGAPTRGEQELVYRVEDLERSLRAAPMPVPESVYPAERWDEVYDLWWHAHASEKALHE